MTKYNLAQFIFEGKKNVRSKIQDHQSAAELQLEAFMLE